jgi:hypothetical protein
MPPTMIDVTVDDDKVMVQLRGLKMTATGPSLGEALTRLTARVVEMEARAEAKTLLIYILADVDPEDRVVLDGEGLP